MKALRKTRHIYFDWGNLGSVTRAQKRKMALENQGYKQGKTTQLGTDKWRIDYEAQK